MTCEESVAAARTALASYGTPTHPLTSEAWRQASSILLKGAAYSPTDICAFGDWQEWENMASDRITQDTRQSSCIHLPVHDNKYFRAEQVKFSVYVGFRQLIQYGSWACIPEGVWATLCSADYHIQEVGSLSAKNPSTEWQCDPLPQVFDGKSFKLTYNKGQLAVEHVEQEMVKPPMPRIKGKALLTHTRHMMPLCPFGKKVSALQRTAHGSMHAQLR